MSNEITQIDELRKRLEDDIAQRKEEALTTAAQYIKTTEKRKAFLNRVNYSLGLTNEYKDKTAKVIENLLISSESFSDAPDKKPEKQEKQPQTIRSIHFFYGKEAARAASIERAKAKYDF